MAGASKFAMLGRCRRRAMPAGDVLVQVSSLPKCCTADAAAVRPEPVMHSHGVPAQFSPLSKDTFAKTTRKLAFSVKKLSQDSGNIKVTLGLWIQILLESYHKQK
jgi:hypothetical protein